jgi:biopolymer transport protein ExbB/TolQ
MESTTPLKTIEPPSGGNTIPADPFLKNALILDWSKMDLERRCGFTAGRFTSVNKWLSFLVALLLTVSFFAVLILVLQQWPPARSVTAVFIDRGFCPYPTMFFFFWAGTLLFFKAKKIKFQRRALSLPLMPQQPEFELTPATARSVRERMCLMVDNPHHFILLNRIDLALANLHNIGRAADVATILKIQAENDEAQVASSYGLVQGFLWAIPVLGFIGTVLGLGQAIGAFAGTLQAGGDLAAIRSSLQAVTGGLSTAFDTTLVALVCALVLQMMVSWMQAAESEFLDACNDICHKHVAGKLRLASV